MEPSLSVPLLRRLAPALIFGASLVILGIGIERARIAAAFSDPAGRIRAQDESIYANSALTMALEGDWMTPKVLGRIFLQKPPLQLWLTAASLKLLGISLLALRLPALIAGSLGVVLVFLWGSRAGSIWTALIATCLLWSDPVWHTFSRLSYTDIFLAVFTMAALHCLFRDPRLESRSALVGFGVATAAAIMTKNIAGILPILVLLLFAALIRRERRPSFARIAGVCLIAALLAAPWHVYQLMVHPQWFWTDYVKIELLGFGLHPPVQASGEIPILFYCKRLFLADPILCILALIAVPALGTSVRQRDAVHPALIAAWLAIVALALSVFQSRNFPYALFLVAPLCLLAASFGPQASPLRQRWTIGLLCVVFVIKTFAFDRPWGLSFGAAAPMPAQSFLRSYADRGRSNPLVLVDPDDQFYSATLLLPKVHYCFLDSNGVVVRYAPHYVDLGITVTAGQFNDLARWAPQFQRRLQDWGLDSKQPIATAVVAASDADVLSIVAAHPFDDFYLPMRFRPLPAAATHQIVPVSADRMFLLAKEPGEGSNTRIARRLPSRW